MKNPLQGPALSIAALAAILSLSLLAAACDSGGGSEANEAENAGSGDAVASEGDSRTGTITIGDETWTVVPAMQCGVYPGDMVAISGHAAENEAIEIVLDHDPSSGLVSVYVKGPDSSPYWIAEDDAVAFEIDGKTVSGSGTFSIGFGAQVADGQPRERQGSFEVRC